MAFEKARQSLSDIENRLRQAFGLAGPIGAILNPEVKPVLITGDLREPGHSFNRGRCFVYWSGLLSTAAASQYYSVRFDADVLVEQLYCPPLIPNGQQVTCYLTVPGQTPAQAITRASVGTWRDNKRADTDAPPISDSGAATGALGGGTGVAQNRTLQIWHGVTPLGGVPSDTPTRNMLIHLPAGSHLNYFVDMGALTMSEYGLCVVGRIWG